MTAIHRHSNLAIMQVKDKVLKFEKVLWRDLQWFQPESLKKQSKLEKHRLKKSLIENNFSIPFFIWDRGKDGKYILDGHHRETALKELEQEGVVIPDQLPALFYDIKDEAEAKKIILVINAKFSNFEKEQLLDWIKTDFSDFEDLLTDLNYKQIRDVDFFSFDQEIEKKLAEQKLEELIDPNLSKSPITYYGGKQKMLRKILMYVPVHDHYVEPFLGGGAVFWRKIKSKINSVNDKLNLISNLYYVLKNEDMFTLFQREVKGILFSEGIYKKFNTLIKSAKDQDILSFEKKKRVMFAVAVWFCLAVSFSSSMTNSFGYVRKKTKKNDTPEGHNISYFNKANIILANDYLCEKLREVQIFSRDALDVISTLDTQNTFFYIDPPYFNADMSFYSGYTEADFGALLTTLSEIKGKFLLSCYDSEILQKYAKAKKWSIKSFEFEVTAKGGREDKLKIKREFLVYNYSSSEFYVNS